MRIPTDTGKIEFATSTDLLKSFDEFTELLKIVEAASIMEKKAKPGDIPLIVKILGFMQKVYKWKSPAEKAQAIAYSKGLVYPISTHLPVYTAICSYNRQDLALAVSHLYHDYLRYEILEITDLTEQGAYFIAFDLLEHFDPTAIPNDLEAKARGQKGEFVRFVGKPMAFYNAVETKRPFQYQQLLGKDYYESKRYKRLQELLRPPAVADETISIPTPALPASNPPEELLKPVEQEPAQEERIVLEVEEVEISEDSFLDDSSFIDVDEQGVEVMDIGDYEDAPEASDGMDWMEDVDVKTK